MVHIEDKKDCCGCGGCAQICPRQCIQMKADREGFLYPSADRKQCIACGLCEKVCPVAHADARNAKPISARLVAYAAYVLNETIREKSSSGGIFSLLAEQEIRCGGVVFGAAMDEDGRGVHHIAVETIGDLELLRGSKYLQSRMGNCFLQVRTLLKEGRRVLFSGTACQIAGLKEFLGPLRDNNALMTVDVLCHGVPSDKVWKAELRNLRAKYGRSVEKVSFRAKQTGWKKFSLYIRFSNGREYLRTHDEDAFMRLFLANICLRPSCHACCFKELSRPSDLTLGDCWGVDRVMPEMDDDRGTSVVLVHTKKGEAMWNQVKSQCCAVSADVDTILPPDSDSRKSVIPHRNRKKLFRLLNIWGGYRRQPVFCCSC